MSCAAASVGEVIIKQEFQEWYRLNHSKRVVDPLKKALSRWATEVSLADGWEDGPDWLFGHAVQTLRCWETNPKLLDQAPRWILGGETTELPVPLNKLHFHFDFLVAWNPIVESRTQARQNAQKAFKADFDAHLDRIEDLLPSGASKTKVQKRRHFDWLVRRLVANTSWNRIAGEVAPGRDNRKTVRDGVGRAADRVGLSRQVLGLPD